LAGFSFCAAINRPHIDLDQTDCNARCNSMPNGIEKQGEVTVNAASRPKTMRAPWMQGACARRVRALRKARPAKLAEVEANNPNYRSKASGDANSVVSASAALF
jgi:hypothetical protein